MSLQGILVKRHQATISQTSESTLKALSGNSVNYFNMSQGLSAAFAALPAELFMA